MNILKKSIPVALALAMCFAALPAERATAQETGGNSLDITGRLLTSPDVILLSNLNLLSSGGNQPLIEATLINNLQTSQSVSLLLQVAQISNGIEGPAQAQIFEATTKPFDLPPGNTIITNIDITSSNPVLGMMLDRLDFNTSAVAGLQDQILRTGKLPVGEYHITVQLNSVTIPGNTATHTEVVSIAAQATLDLVGPGLVADQSNPCVEVFTLNPQFSWVSEANSFLLTVAEVLPTNSSPEDVMQNEPRAQLRVMRGTPNIESAMGNAIYFLGSPNVVYPSTGVLALQPGKTYYWQIQIIQESASGEIFLPGEIWCFKVANIDGAAQAVLGTGVLNALRVMFSGTQYESLLADDGPLTGFLPTTMRINGRGADLFELNLMVPDFATGKKRVLNVTIETIGE